MAQKSGLLNFLGNTIELKQHLVCCYGSKIKDRSDFTLFCQTANKLPSLQFLWIGDISKIEPPSNLFVLEEGQNQDGFLEFCDLLLFLSTGCDNEKLVKIALEKSIPVVGFSSTEELSPILLQHGYIISGRPKLSLLTLFIEHFIMDYIELGQSCHEKQDLEGAIDNYKKAIEETSDRPSWVYCSIIDCLQSLNELDEAIKYADKAIELYPEDNNLYRLLGLIRDKKGNVEELIDNYNYIKAIELENRQPSWVYCSLTNNLISQEQLDTTIEFAKRGLELYPENVELYTNLGVALDGKGDTDGVVESYSKAIELEPKQPYWLYCALVEKLKIKGKLEKAIDLGKQGISLYEECFDLYFHLGVVQYENEDFLEAITNLTTAISLNPDYSFTHYYLGKTFDKIGDVDSSISSYKKFIDLEPNNMMDLDVDFYRDLQKVKPNEEIRGDRISNRMAVEIAKTLFDYEFYQKQHAFEQNIKSLTKKETFKHFLKQELNSESLLAAPNSWFFPEIYKDIHSPHEPLKLNPFLHYIENGYIKGLQPLHGLINIPLDVIKERIKPFFEDEFYLSHSPDLDPKQINPLEHFILFGWREKRNPASWFSISDYLREFPVVRDLEINPLYFYACLHPGDPRRWKNKQYNKTYSKFGKAFKITPTRENNMQPKSVIEFQSLLKQAGYFQPERYSKNLTKAQANRLKIHLVIPEFSKGGGGHMTIFRIVRWLEFFGHECTVWVQDPDFSSHSTGWRDDVYRYFQQVKASFRPLNNHFWYTTGDILVATGWQTVEAVMANEGFNDRFYLVQDYEPYFFARGSNSLRAEDTYRQDIACICASSWLKKLMEEKFGRWARHFNLAYESDVYKVYEENDSNTLLESDEDSICHLVVYSRKHTARRAVELCLEALDELALRRSDFVVHFFGDEEIITDISYNAFHHGIMDKQELADLYNNGTIGVTFSATNYSLVPQEMMACGLPIVEIDNESTVSIFPSDVVSLARPNPKAIADTIQVLMNDSKKREHQKNSALEWISELSWETSVRSVEQAFLDRLREIGRLEESVEASSIQIKEKYQYHAAVMIPTFNAGKLFRQVLDRVRQQHTPWPFQIVIVDSSSNDGTQEYLDRQQDILFHTIPQSQFQHGATRNLGVRLSDAEYVAFLTQDALPASNYWLYDLVSCLEAHPSAAGVFGRHIAYEEATEFTKRDLLQHFAGFDRFPVELSLQTDFEKIKRGDKGWQQVLHFYSDNNSCLRRSVWEKYPYPEVAYGEDQFWADIIIKAGYSKVYSKAALVYHSHDYNYQETFKRSKTEAEFFFSCFGYKMVNNRKQMEIDLAAINKRDIEYGKEKGLKMKEISHQLNLNRAKFEGWAS